MSSNLERTSDICLICKEKFAYNEKSNVERHFTRKHASFATKYASEELFRDFKNKADFLERIKELQLSAKTIKDRKIKMYSNITTQHIKELKMVSVLSIAVDESCDINDTAQVSVFARFMSHSVPKEELLGLLPLKSQTHGEDIANGVIECTECLFQQMGAKV